MSGSTEKQNSAEKTDYIVPCEKWLPENQVLPLKFREIYQQIQDVEVYDDDVWVVTYPKAGTHWMQETLCCLLHGMDFEKLKSTNYLRSINIETECLSFCEKIPEVKLNILSKYHDSLERPRTMKTHLFWDKLPKALRDPNCKAKIVYVARNPKDTCVSRFYYTQMIPGEEYRQLVQSFDAFCNEFVNDKLAFSPFWGHIFDFWNRRHNPNILFVKYEEMKTDFSKVLDKLQTFLHLEPLTTRQKEKLADYLSFDKMKDNEAVNLKKFAGNVYRNTYSNSGEEANFFRKGQVGGWRSEMSPEIVKRFDDWILKNTAGTDYSVEID